MHSLLGQHLITFVSPVLGSAPHHKLGENVQFCPHSAKREVQGVSSTWRGPAKAESAKCGWAWLLSSQQQDLHLLLSLEKGFLLVYGVKICHVNLIIDILQLLATSNLGETY